MLVPAEAIEQIVEYDARPLPFADSRVGGIAIIGSNLVVSLCPAGREQNALPAGKTTGALLVSEGARSGEGVRYAVEVTRVISLVTVKAHRLGRGIADDAWFGEGTTTDGRTLPMLDVARMLTELGVVGPREGRTS